MLAILLGLLGLCVGVAGEEVGWLVGALAGVALGVALDAAGKSKTALAGLAEARAEISRLTFELNMRDRPKVPLAPSVPSQVRGVAGSEQGTPDGPRSGPADVQATAPVERPPAAMSHGTEVPSATDHKPAYAPPHDTAPQPSATPAPVGGPAYAASGSGDAMKPNQPPSAPPLPSPVTLAYQWLFGGNTVVRVGLVVLMVGVVLLLKWAADNELFPIEARLTLAALIGIALLVFGYRVRESKPGFGLTLQGGGIAGLYLTTFFAYRFYALIPSGFAFAVLAALALFTCALSHLQLAQGLALIGLLGGYLAPILASSGGGSHVALFAYTALLNAVVLVLVALRGWVNVARLGFLFTFGFLVGWRVLRYEPEHLSTTEPFVLLFFLAYLAVPILLMRRAEAGKLRGLGILFGTPLATLGVQAALLHQEPLYMALATVSLGLIYVLVASQLSKRGAALRELSIAFVAIASCLATVAIPYALQTKGATGAAWAIEGAGIIWFALRQKQTWTAAAGAILQLVGLVLYLLSLDATPEPGVVSASVQSWLGAWLQAGALYVTGYLGFRDARQTVLGKVLQAGLLAGTAAFILGPFAPILDYTHGSDSNACIGLWVSVGVVLLDRLALALHYALGRFPSLVVLPFVPIFLLACAVESSHVFEGWQGPAWLAVGAAVYYVLRFPVSERLPRLAWAFGVCTWWLCAVLTVELLQLTNSVWELGDGWVHAAFLLTPVAVVLVSSRGTAASNAFAWLVPREANEDVKRSVPLAILEWGATPIVLGMALLLLAQNAFVSGDVEPLPYLVIANPLDVLQLVAFGAIWRWTRRIRAERLNQTLTDIANGYGYAVFALAFVWFNAMLARSVHHYAGVEFSPAALFHSDIFQVTVSVTWAVLAMALMWWTSRVQWRGVWFVGAGLLGATIVKLFLIDLSRLGTGAKILTFLAVGLLVLLIGYLSPVPPSTSVDRAEDDEPGSKKGEV